MVSPVVGVGERVIELAPTSVERWAIEALGTNDKPALVVGITITCLVLGAFAGVAARRRRWLWLATMGVFGTMGVLGSLDGRRSFGVAVVPSSLAALAGAGCFFWLLRFVPSDAQHEEPARTEMPTERPKLVAGSRRAFLAASAGLAVASVVLESAGDALGRRFSAAASRASVRLPRPRAPLAELPSTVNAPVDGIAPFVTPNTDFYRVDTALVVPQVRTEDWELVVTGLVDRPLRLSYTDLLDRPLVEVDITMTCVSNTVGGKLVGNARWLGVRLAELLDEVGVSPGADQLVGRSVDGWTSGFPVAAAFDRDALVAVGMNGEPLPIEHGFPARLVVPGLYGYLSATKWLTEIELTTFSDVDSYWVRRGWSADGRILTMARIDTPRVGRPIAAGTIAIGGVAWAQRRGIAKVEVRIDDGPWQLAQLAAVPNEDTWRQWWLPWDATPGRHTIAARATDGAGELQTDLRAEPFPGAATGWHQILVTVT